MNTRPNTLRHILGAALLISAIQMSYGQSADAQETIDERQETIDERFDQIEQRIDHLQSRIQGTGTAAVLFLFAAFCALWAQNSNRNAWLWSFLGWIFHVMAVIVLLAKNSDDRRAARGDPPLNPAWVVGGVIVALVLVGALAVWLFEQNW